MPGISVESRLFDKKVSKALRVIDAKNLLNLIGTDQLSWVHLNFRQGGAEKAWHPLSPNTIAQRRGGSSRPLRDTGRLEQSFNSELNGNRVRVGTNLQIAPFHHYGTRPYTIRPRAGKMLTFKTPNGRRFAKVVHHPGLPARPLIPSKSLAERLAVRSIDNAIKVLSDGSD